MRRSDSNLVEIKIRLPKPLMDEFNALFWDPVRQRPLYGARTKIIRAGLERYIKEQKDARAKQQRDGGAGATLHLNFPKDGDGDAAS